MDARDHVLTTIFLFDALSPIIFFILVGIVSCLNPVRNWLFDFASRSRECYDMFNPKSRLNTLKGCFKNNYLTIGQFTFAPAGEAIKLEAVIKLETELKFILSKTKTLHKGEYPESDGKVAKTL